MKMIDFVKQGRVITAAGYSAEVKCVEGPGDPFPIKGSVTANNITFDCEWDENGYPHKLPLTHGLDLLATVPITSYKILTKGELANANDFSDFVDA